MTEEQERMVMQWRPMVVKVASWYAKRVRRLDMDDLVSCGVEAVCRAALRYDPTRPGKRRLTPAGFGTVAYRYASAAIAEAVPDLLGVVRVPRAMLCTRRAVEDGKRASESTLRSLEKAAAACRSTSQLSDDTLTTEDRDGPDEDEIDRLRQWMTRLTERERHVLWQRFGFCGDQATLEEVGKELGVCKERVRQVEREALERLREMARGGPSRRDSSGPGDTRRDCA